MSRSEFEFDLNRSL